MTALHCLEVLCVVILFGLTAAEVLTIGAMSNKLVQLLLITMLLGGCATEHKLAQCDGPLATVNATDWQPSREELTALQTRLLKP